jgi:hypothetical protein
MSDQSTIQVPDVHPMMLVNCDNYRERMEEYAAQLGQFVAQHPAHASLFGPLYESLRALQTAVQDETLTRFETLLVQQVYGYHFYTMVWRTKDYELLPEELHYGLAGIEHTTFGLLYSSTGILRAMTKRKTPLLPLLDELLSQLASAISACEPEETQRLHETLSPMVERLSEATMTLNDALAEERPTAEIQAAVGEWRKAAEQYDTVFVEAFHEHYVPFGCVKGHHLIHEIDKGIAWLLQRMKDALTKQCTEE